MPLQSKVGREVNEVSGVLLIYGHVGRSVCASSDQLQTSGRLHTMSGLDVTI